MDATILTQIWDFLYETGILFVLLGAALTALISRVALVPALKKIDAIIDCFIEKAEDGEVTPEDAAVIFSVIKEQIGSDFLVKIFGIFFKASVPTEKLQGLTCK
jgi:hypothetical protein